MLPRNAFTERERRVLALLGDGNFHSGEELAGCLGGISRAAIWKVIQALVERGIDVHAVRGRGYCLANPLELLDQDRIAAELNDEVRHLVSAIEVYPWLDSTNTYLMQRARAGCDSGLACFAEAQTAGRGRRGRSWISPFGANLYFSLLWRFPANPPALTGLSLVIGIAVAHALEKLGVEGIGLKWPNDILWQQRKLGGILLEFGGESTGPCHVVAGVGVNVAMPQRAGQIIDQAWVDMRHILGSGTVSRNRMAGCLLSEMVTACQRFQSWGFRPFREAWKPLDLTFEQPVVLTLPTQTITGIAKGIDAEGCLCLDTGSGRQRFTTGEVSLRFTP